MRTRAANIALTATLALTGLVAGVVLGPALATAATSEESAADAVGSRVDRIEQALQGLVDDGTLDASQRDAVAERLAEQLPPRGRGPGELGRARQLALDVAASTLDLTEQELVAQLREGRSLAQLAEEQGVPLEELTSALQQAAEERLARAVESGRLTQDEADEQKAQIAERIADAVQREGLARPGRGHGWGPGGRPGAGAEPPAAEPEGSQDGATTEPSVHSS